MPRNLLQELAELRAEVEALAERMGVVEGAAVGADRARIGICLAVQRVATACQESPPEVEMLRKRIKSRDSRSRGRRVP